jgi:hypothetical protein
MWWLAEAAMVACIASCGPSAVRDGRTKSSTPSTSEVAFSKPRVRSFTDTLAVTALADSPSQVWVGSTHGLVRWSPQPGGTYTVLTAHDGLLSERISALAVDGAGAVWIATPKALSRLQNGVFTHFPPAPVGAFVTALKPSPDGKSLWAAGPEGLARLRSARWERYLSDLGITALTVAPSGMLWIGTSGKGVLRMPRPVDRLEQFGTSQGCDVDVVRGLASAGDEAILAVGEGSTGPKAALFDGERFFPYAATSPAVIEWVMRAGAQTVLGEGGAIFQVAHAPVDPEGKTPAPTGAVTFAPASPRVARAGRTISLKPNLLASALEDPAATLPAESGAPPPRLTAEEAPVRLPEGVTAVSASERGLLLGTRFQGAMRIENGVPRSYQMNDLAQGAERLTVACASKDDCYLATGGPRAWRFDGQSFTHAAVDPEPRSRVLAVLRDPRGHVIAIHRGAHDEALRFSLAAGGHFTPISVQRVSVPVGAPALNFAQFAPDHRLWLGLRYIDEEKDPVDCGAAEVDLERGQVVYHRQSGLPSGATRGIELPNDMVAMYFRSAHEAWFATRSGAARMLDGRVRVFTENDGLESELVRDIESGLGGEVWVATRHGVGRFDGRLWHFPKMGPFYLPATALVNDGRGHVFIGSSRGVHCVGDCAPEPVDARSGLGADEVIDLAVDSSGRVWALTARGISVIEP